MWISFLDDFDAVLTISHSHRYGANASEAAEKTSTDKKIITNAPRAL